MRPGKFRSRAVAQALLLASVAWAAPSAAQSTLPPCQALRTHLHDCMGTLSLPDGTYVGEIRKGKPNGSGTLTFNDGDEYVGAFRDGAPFGPGVLTSANGNKYVGDWQGGKQHGLGTLTYANGDIYVGGFQDGVRSGQGTLASPGGDRYVGAFRDDKRSGQGTQVFANGARYAGEWHQDKPHGHGVYVFADGKRYVGAFVHGERSGTGTLTFIDGLQYTGSFRHGKQDGNGTLTFPNGDRYTGFFRDGKRSGQGVYLFADGNKYAGEYRDDKPNGHGTYTFADGTRFVGEFRDGRRHGYGVEYAAGESIRQRGYWRDDVYAGRTPPPGIDAPPQRVRLVPLGSSHAAPVLINDAALLYLVIDGEAADVSIPPDAAMMLARTGNLADRDFTGTAPYRLPDGSILPSRSFTIRSLTLGDTTFRDVAATVSDIGGPIRLGQSLLGKLKTWSIDVPRAELVFEVPN